LTKKNDILVAGEINPDLILTDPNLEPRFGQQEILVEQATLTIGSSAAIFACGAARLGLKVAIIGVVGVDTFGNFMLDALTQRQVDVSPVICDNRLQTGLTVHLNRITDRALITFMGAINTLHAGQIGDELLSKTEHLHIGSYFLLTALQPGLLDLFRRARALGLTTSLDTNWDPTEKWAGVQELLPQTTVFLPNAAEARSISKFNTTEEAIDSLASKLDYVAVKLGREGAIARHRDDLVKATSIRVEVVDSVGAGDSFDAGFLYGFLHRWSLEDSLKLGIACGALSTQGAGGTQAQPTLAEALEAMKLIQGG